jgi:hypothetical protein
VVESASRAQSWWRIIAKRSFFARSANSLGLGFGAWPDCPSRFVGFAPKVQSTLHHADSDLLCNTLHSCLPSRQAEVRGTVSAWWIARLGLAVALVAIAWFAALPVIPPDLVPTTAPKDAFSAERAMEELRVVARAPHPAGSAAQGRVREYILARPKRSGCLLRCSGVVVSSRLCGAVGLAL